MNETVESEAGRVGETARLEKTMPGWFRDMVRETRG